MKIGLSVTSILPPKCQFDGIGTYSSNLVHALEDIPEIVVSRYAFPSYYLHNRNNLNSNFFPLPFEVSVANSILFRRPFVKSTEISLFHATDHRIPHFKDIPVVATLNDAVPLLKTEWVRSRLRWLKNWAFYRSVQWARHVIALSHAVVPDLVSAFGISENKISVIPLGVSEHYFHRATSEEKLAVLHKYGLREGYYLFIGTLQPRKNVEGIIAAHRLLPMPIRREHPLVLVGRNGWRTENLLADISQLTAEGTGKWLNHVPQADLPILLQAASAFVFPSLYEGFGMPLLEAFASQIPVVTSNTSALPEVAGDAAVLVNPYSSGEISAGMREVLENQHLRAELCQRGLRRAQTMTWSKCAKLTANVYQRVLNGHV